ncbi:3-mercaptopyruvate sulfurtransferase-like [Scleropages formosus]|uniref:3-mercaptopyruvate sulfurtransferase-like n=1 Tax=Scleropages formosus TaxID=113540 RepID=A0A8D0CJU2_SCLFO|nr:3-mercaptopyruvate sulfurtransferase-like [Scleropages formosus]
MTCLPTGALVTARWLGDAVRSGRVGASLRVLDASWHLPALQRRARREFEKKHIPGAAFFDLERCCDRTSPLEHMLPPERHFADYVGSLGVANHTHVVVYDASDLGSFSAPRVWWMFQVFGHAHVSVLDGGLRHWLREGLPVTGGAPKSEPLEFRATLQRSRVKSYGDILDNVVAKDFQVVDARPAGQFLGTAPEPRHDTEPGHIPGSINMPFSSFLQPSGLHKRPKELAVLFQDAGVDLSRPLCVSCDSAVTACHVALAAHLCGHSGTLVYDGGWSEWYARAPPEYVISEGWGKRVLLRRGDQEGR